MLAQGVYRGTLYDIGFDKPETQLVEKDGVLYYAFYAPRWSEAIENVGLAPIVPTACATISTSATWAWWRRGSVAWASASSAYCSWRRCRHDSLSRAASLAGAHAHCTGPNRHRYVLVIRGVRHRIAMLTGSQ